MKQSVINELRSEQITATHSQILTQATQWVNLSRGHMSGMYEEWDENLKMYDSTAPVKKSDELAKEEERPTSQAVPMTWAQIQVWTAFATQLLSQKEYQFEHTAVSPEDESYRELADMLLHADLTDNQWEVIRGQFLRHVGIFGLGIFKHRWENKIVGLTETTPYNNGTEAVPEMVNKDVETEILLRMGNRIENVSPYQFFPDPSFPLHRLNDGRFCACEFEISRQELKQMELSNSVINIDAVPRKFTDTQWDSRSRNSRLALYKHEEKNEIVVVTEVMMKVIPYYFELSDGTRLGDSKREKIILVWIANDSRIIKLEDYNYVHCQFGYDVGVLDSEQHKFIRKSFVKLGADLQNTIDWHLNARVESVTRNIEPQLIVDPYAIDIASVRTNQRIITMKKGAARAGIDRFIKQLQTTDPTARSMSDISDLMKLDQITLGINDNMLGQYSSGRRSATEARVVAGGTAARAMTIVKEIWAMCFNPMGNKLTKNLRAGLTAEYIKRFQPSLTPETFAAYSPGRSLVAQSRDFFTVDSTSPSEKGFIAQSLQELLGIMMTNPENAVMFDMSPKLLMEKIMELRGLRFGKSFSVTNDPQLLQQLIQQQAQALAQQLLAQYVQQSQLQSQQPPEA